MSFTGINFFDIFLIVACCYFIIRGMFRGIIGEIITLAGFLISFYLVFHYHIEVGKIIADTIGSNSCWITDVIAALLIWLSVSISASILRMVLKRFICFVKFTAVDKLLGLCTGTIKSLILIYAIITAGLLLAPVVNPTWLTKSDIIRYAGREWPIVHSVLIDCNVLPEDTTLPNGELEIILRPYRRGKEAPRLYSN